MEPAKYYLVDFAGSLGISLKSPNISLISPHPSLCTVSHLPWWKPPTLGINACLNKLLSQKAKVTIRKIRWRGLKRWQEWDSGTVFRFVAAVSVPSPLQPLSAVWVGFKSRTFRVSNLKWHVSKGWIYHLAEQSLPQKCKMPEKPWLSGRLFLCRQHETSFYAAAQRLGD